MKTANHFRPSASAKDFIDSLIDLQSGWQLPRKQLFIYRGVGDLENHPLVPTAFRAENKQRLIRIADLFDDSIYYKLDDGLKQAFLEFRIVERFLAIADQSGLSIPTIDHDIRGAFSEFSSDRRDEQFQSVLGNWPPIEIVPLISLAQHYGLPTRLLDWSYDILTATYFAVESALRIRRSGSDINPKEKHLAVWVCNAHELNSFERRHSETKELGLTIEVHSPPKYQNPNLMAQSGVFTWIAGRDAFNPDVFTKPLDVLAGELFKEQSELDYREVLTFGVLSLSWDHAEELMTRLFNLGVSRAKLQPGFGGVAETLEQLSHLNWTPPIAS
jgi:hypothetical protein